MENDDNWRLKVYRDISMILNICNTSNLHVDSINTGTHQTSCMFNIKYISIKIQSTQSILTHMYIVTC